MKHLPLFCDFETRSTVDLGKCGADVYARHPSTEVMCMGYAFGDEPAQLWLPGQPLPERVIQHILRGGVVVAHNAPFELVIWLFVCVKYGWLRLSPEQLVCTMAMSYAMALPGALADVANAVNLSENKDNTGHRVMMQLSQPRKSPESECIVCGGEGYVFGHQWELPASCFCTTWYTPESHPEKFEKLYAYCLQDVEVERQLYNRLLQLSPDEQEIWKLDRRINDRGVKVDLEAVRGAIKLVESESERLDRRMREATSDHVATCSAVDQLTAWLNRRGIQVTSVDKSAISTLLEKPDLGDDIRQALLLRQEAAKSSTAKLDAMLRGVCEDGRLRGMFQYHGAGTGRWAGRRVQLQNLPRSQRKQEEIDAIFEIFGSVQ